MKHLAPYLKAITAAIVAGLTALASALDDGTVTAQEWVWVVSAFLVALGAVWAVPNAPTNPPKEG